MTINTDPQACITLDLEPDFGGRVPVDYAAWRPERVARLLEILERGGAPLTVFVVADSLERRPEIITRLQRGGAEFQLHSYSHDLDEPDSQEEIHRGREAFERFFGHKPEGYRAPEGRISPEGWGRLAREGFLFDASVVPSFWPRPRYLRHPRRPFRTPEGLLELPYAVVSPLRVPMSLSWMKLLGWPLFDALSARCEWPQALVFGSHLHDLGLVPSVERLGEPWRRLYARNAEAGFPILEHFLAALRARGYRFTTMGALARGLARVSS